MTWNAGAPVIKPFHSVRLERELGASRRHGEEVAKRHEDIAKSLHVVTEEIILHLLERLYEKTRCPNVSLTGGVAMNSVANGKVTSQTPCQRVYIPDGAADNGTSFGAAYYVWHRILGRPRSSSRTMLSGAVHPTRKDAPMRSERLACRTKPSINQNSSTERPTC